MREAPHLRTLAGTCKPTRLDLVADDRERVTLWREPELLRNAKRLQTKMERR